MFLPHRFTIYVLGDVIQLFLVSLFGMTTLIMLGLVLHQLYIEGLGFGVFTQLLPYATTMSLQYSIPATLLFSVCTIYGRISADNEIMAVKSAGISPMRIIKPTLIFALLLSPFAVWMSELAVSWGTPGFKRVVLHSLEEIIYGKLRTNRSYSSQQGLAIHVQDVDGHWLIQPTITMYDNGPITIKAEKARISLNEANESLMIELVKYELDSKNKLYFNGGKDSNLVEVPLSKAAQKNSPERSASLVSLRDMASQKRQLEAETDLRRDQLLTRSSVALASGRLSLLQDASANSHRGFLNESEARMHRLNAEPWRRWALGFSCFSFVWVGIPLAILRRSADYTATFAVCFLPILFLYYPLFSLGMGQAKSGDWHPSAPWIANLALIAIGAWMLRRVYCE